MYLVEYKLEKMKYRRRALQKAELGIFSLSRNSERLAGTFRCERSCSMKIGFFKQ
jgi:hypothetical protein